MSGDAVSQVLERLDEARATFQTVCAIFAETDANYAPRDDMYTVAEQVGHSAAMIDWFLRGAIGGGDPARDYLGQDQLVRSTITLVEAKAWLADAFDRARDFFSKQDAGSLSRPIVDCPLLEGHPLACMVVRISEHCAHHRGALGIYARMLGKAPPVPYSKFVAGA